jgi:hypothetical protein
MKTKNCLLIAAILVSLLYALPLLSGLFGTSALPVIVNTNSTYQGKTYGEWSAMWWKWLLSIPQDKSPVTDFTGKNCHINQNSSLVWYLVGSGGAKIPTNETSGTEQARTCLIPEGRGIFFALITGACSFAEFPNYKSISQLQACSSQDPVSYLRATIDGSDIPNLKSYRIQSPEFNLTLPDNNAFGLKPQTTVAVSDGYFIMLEPLSKGVHTLKFEAHYGDPVETVPIYNEEHANYILVVK